MIRKVLMASAIAVLPVAAVTTVGLSGVASAAKAPPPAAATCAVGGSITFPNSGLTMFGDTAKTGSSPVNLTSSSAQCTGTNSNITIKTKSAKCKAPVTTASFVDGAITVYPASNIYLPQVGGGGTLPVCQEVQKKPTSPFTYSKNDEADSAWSFAGGVAVNGVQTSTASQLPAELKKGVPVVDGGVTYTLLVSSASSISPGGVCGSSEVGFALSGTVKKYSGSTWSSNVCLGADTVAAGTSTAGTFLGDLTNLILATGNTSAAGGAPLGSPVNTAITGATIDAATSTLTIS